ncbi:hypothetical protein Smp_053060.1 [Schistosoma mansoni]|uniref:hypothetical protein n=1 Tax=Schistosoma mansoni TaxID=6183 RepID=UPI0001A634EF|nr:hypothetical protein Smp_053060.1 [Schistosoma mansoni]|eukprot:XP_018652621.1 hypothetical protein Smp_053060.1 [Schistosoma mansoni]
MSSGCCSDDQDDGDEDSDSSIHSAIHNDSEAPSSLYSKCINGSNRHNPLIKISREEADLCNAFTKCIRHDSGYNGFYLQPMHKCSSSTHISVLPFELLLRIIRWAIGSHLNIRVLGVLSCVCRGFYLLANDNSIWRDICFKLWPVWLTYNNNNIGCNNQLSYLSSMNYTSWREMAIYRPQVLYHGEPEIGSSYKPVFKVVYYRGIRFHVSSNQISMFTAPSNPSSIVAVLSKSHQSLSSSMDVSLVGNNNNNNSNSEAVMKTAVSGTLLKGTYEWYDHDSIVCTLHQFPDKQNRPSIRRRQHLGPVIPQLTVTFTIKFKIGNKRGCLHNQLLWDSYVIHTFDKSSAGESTTVLELTNQHFPPCRFVRVRNFIPDVTASPL